MAERDLWRAILALAVSDTLYEGDAPVACDARDAAREWFRFGGRDFRFTCVMAGFDPDAVQARYMAGKFSAVSEAGRAFMHHSARQPRIPGHCTQPSTKGWMDNRRSRVDEGWQP
ncbi:hypothetical protein PhaeoP66_04684 (plasmid) [Phaeobacter inhibens]|uniref:Uncharacterized protein n=1 Tax=Phaeobacter inhibens TaxID=221822 RepID=A0ABN5GVR3_9RHOB|nr:hypothetical protein [Phaeobacter inhibens]AUQ93847.1 hypothetical protein PhaeoP66_01043 [Phaeobacter inhibens]AUQ97410.1 hypothetical protein PhaeoP66_04684 [Phaeobacter inhibens]UWR89189.1 hypothetical protein K4L01_03375 [Phaeobacter inhibens]